MKLLILIAIPLLALAACGSDEQSSYFGGNKAKDPPPLAENPPLGADDIDAIVNAEKQKSNPSPATPATQQENTNGN